MKKFLKINVTVLAVLMLLSSFAFASEEGVAALLMSNPHTRHIAALVFSASDVAEIANKAAQEEKKEVVSRGNAAYVVSAYQRLNMESGKYYAELNLINETGEFSVLTVEDVENYNFLPVLTSERVGEMRELKGKFVLFDMRKTDKIQKLEPRHSAVKTTFSTEDGFYLVNVTASRNGILSFYDTDSDVSASENPQSCRFAKRGHAIIGIDGETYSGELLSTAGKKQEEFFEGLGNAVIQVSEGEIVRVFSFNEGYEI